MRERRIVRAQLTLWPNILKRRVFCDGPNYWKGHPLDDDEVARFVASITNLHRREES